MDIAATDFFRVDRDSELPVGIQVAWRLRAMISSGKLAPGDQLPTVRQLAKDAGVNPNTARAIYGRLESEGLVETRHGLGTFVAPEAASSSEVERIAADAVAEARRAGVSPADVARSIYGARWAAEDAPVPEHQLPDVGAEADEAAARRELRRQIARLEADLAAYPESRPESETHPLLRPKGHLPDFAELSAARDALIGRLRKVRARTPASDRRPERR